MFDIKQRREQLGLTQDDVANAAHVSRGTVSKWESGDIANMKRDKIADVAKLLRVSPLLFLGIDSNDSKTPSHTYTYFPASIAAGALCEVDPFTHDQAESITLSDATMGKYAGDKDIIVMHVNGESMNRVIPNGSLIAVKPVDYVRNGDIVVAANDEGYTVKRYYYNDKLNVITLQPDSSDSSFEPLLYASDDTSGIKVIGKVIVYTVVI